MSTRRDFLKYSAATIGMTTVPFTAAMAAETMPVVATFSILGDMVARIGGDHVAVTTLIGPNGDTHVYQPTPADARSVSDAKLLVVNGLGFEGWLDRLIDASEFDGQRVVATDGIELLAFEEGGHDDHHGGHKEKAHGDEDHADHDHDHEEHAEHAEKHAEHDHDHEEHAEHDHDGEEHADAHGHDHHDHGEFDPHGWQSLKNAQVYARNIAAALAAADPAHAAAYEANLAAYLTELAAVDAEIRKILTALPEDRRTIITSHDAFQYFGRDYGLTFVAPQGLSTESEASAKDVAHLIERIRDEKVAAVFVENVADRRLLEQIARETGAGIGGTLYPGALSEADGPASTYIDMMRHNASTLAAALSS
ncbi:MAG: zinc ABC transporter substrate-binding protein [Pseudomonadota bacterium]